MKHLPCTPHIALSLSLFSLLVVTPLQTANSIPGIQDIETIDFTTLGTQKKTPEHNNQGPRADVKKIGKHDQANQQYQQVAADGPGDFEKHFNLATSFYKQNDTQKAIEHYLKALAINPKNAQAHHNLGICLSQKKKLDEALVHFEKATECNPAYTKAYLQQASLLYEQKKKHEALACYKRGIEHDPSSFDLWYRAGGLLKELDQFKEALEYYTKAEELNPNHINLLLEIGNTYNMLDSVHKALEYYKKILEINPKALEALYNFGYTLKKMGYMKEAIEVYEKILEQRPNYAHPHFSLSLALLSLGEFDRGWKEYEWRWAAYDESPKKFKEPLWDGSDPKGKRILLYAEQGLGDTLQFIRYAKLIKDQGGTVILETQKPLKDLLSLCPYLDAVIARGESVPEFDYQMPLMSLPLIYNSNEDTIPLGIPYLYAQPQLIKEWKEKLSHDEGIKIGICWQGNPNYRTQFLRQTVAAKSITVDKFAPIGRLPGVKLYSLQKISGDDQLEQHDDSFFVHDFGPDFDNRNGRFMDTAAVMKNLDLVITVDTSICHLAGGLGVPVWIFLPEPPDWRWMLKRPDTPWYPNMRLFRQPTMGDWNSVIQDIVYALQETFGLDKSEPGSEAKSTRSNEVFSTTTPAPSHEESLANLMDSYSCALVKKELNSSAQQNPEYDQLHALYASYSTQLPDLNPLMEQLHSVNKQLIILEQLLQKNRTSIHNQEFIDLARKACCIYDLKTFIKTKIN